MFSMLDPHRPENVGQICLELHFCVELHTKIGPGAAAQHFLTCGASSLRVATFKSSIGATRHSAVWGERGGALYAAKSKLYDHLYSHNNVWRQTDRQTDQKTIQSIQQSKY